MDTPYIQGISHVIQFLKIAELSNSRVTRKLRALVTYAYENDLPDQFIETAKDQIIGKAQDVAIDKAQKKAKQAYDYEKKRRIAKADY